MDRSTGSVLGTVSAARSPLGQGANTAPIYDTLSLERVDGHIPAAALNRPDVLDAINTQMGLELLDLWATLTANPHVARVIILTGAGERAFCTGADLTERNGMSETEWRTHHEILERGFVALMNCPVPTIAAVIGDAFGGGLELALGCDFIYAEKRARFALPEVTLGIMPGSNGTQTLARAASERRAKEVVLTGRHFTAADGCDWGIFNRLCTGGRRLRRRPRHRLRHRGERAAVGPSGEEGDPLWLTAGSRQRVPVRDPGIQQTYPDGRSP